MRFQTLYIGTSISRLDRGKKENERVRQKRHSHSVLSDARWRAASFCWKRWAMTSSS